MAIGLLALTALHIFNRTVGALGRHEGRNGMNQKLTVRNNIHSLIESIWAVGASGLAMFLPGAGGLAHGQTGLPRDPVTGWVWGQAA